MPGKDLWQRSFEELSQIERNRRYVYRKRGITKTELEKRIKNKRGEEMSPEYNTNVSFDIKKGEIYEVLSVEEITTRTNLQGVRVELHAKNSNDNRAYAVTLWPSDQVINTSKWGSFLIALGSNTDNWSHKWIRIDEWQNRLCEVTLVPAPKPVGKLAKKAVSELGAEIMRENSY